MSLKRAYELTLQNGFGSDCRRDERLRGGPMVARSGTLRKPFRVGC